MLTFVCRSMMFTGVINAFSFECVSSRSGLKPAETTDTFDKTLLEVPDNVSSSTFDR